jgi:hypothetical protein
VLIAAIIICAEGVARGASSDCMAASGVSASG